MDSASAHVLTTGSMGPQRTRFCRMVLAGLAGRGTCIAAPGPRRLRPCSHGARRAGGTTMMMMQSSQRQPASQPPNAGRTGDQYVCLSVCLGRTTTRFTVCLMVCGRARRRALLQQSSTFWCLFTPKSSVCIPFTPSRESFVTYNRPNQTQIASFKWTTPSLKCVKLSGPVFSAKLFSKSFRLQLELYYRSHPFTPCNSSIHPRE